MSKKKINRARDAEGKRVDPHYFIKAYSLTAKAKVDGVKSYIKKFIEICNYYLNNIQTYKKHQ